MKFAVVVVVALAAGFQLGGCAGMRHVSPEEFLEKGRLMGSARDAEFIGVAQGRAYLSEWSLIPIVGPRIRVYWTEANGLSSEAIAELDGLRAARKVEAPRTGGRQVQTMTASLSIGASASGSSIAILDQGLMTIASTPEAWAELKTRVYGAKAPTEVDGLRPDWSKEIVLAIYEGSTFNCSGIELESADEDESRIRIRTRHSTYQSGMQTPTTWPYGFFVLPRRPAKDYVIEENHQHLLGAPPVWREDARLRIKG